MASVTSSPSPSSPPSPSNSQNSATHPIPTPSTPSNLQDVASGNGVPASLEEKPPSVDPYQEMVSEEYTKKFSKYEADYTHRLMAKYFSDKDIYGDSIFEESMAIGSKTMKASRWHGAQSYADPVQFLKDKNACSSTSPADTPSRISNGKHSLEKAE